MSTTSPAPVPGPALVDPRGPRAGAWATSLVLAAVLLVSGSDLAAGLLLAAQGAVFALGSRGRSPYVLAWRRWVRPRLAPPVELEAAAPPRFAQLVGLAFAVVGLVGFATGTTLLGQLATGLALVAALLNAAAGVCLGCELYLLYTRSTTRGATA